MFGQVIPDKIVKNNINKFKYIQPIINSVFYIHGLTWTYL